MEYNKLGKVELIAAIEKLEAEKAQLNLNLQHVTNVAQWFGAVLGAIETVLANSPFVNKEGKFFKKLFWVISNFDKIKALIEEIAARIKEWRDKIKEIEKNAPKPQ